jgi:hypothetical protein
MEITNQPKRTTHRTHLSLYTIIRPLTRAIQIEAKGKKMGARITMALILTRLPQAKSLSALPNLNEIGTALQNEWR